MSIRVPGITPRDIDSFRDYLLRPLAGHESYLYTEKPVGSRETWKGPLCLSYKSLPDRRNGNTRGSLTPPECAPAKHCKYSSSRLIVWGLNQSRAPAPQ